MTVLKMPIRRPRKIGTHPIKFWKINSDMSLFFSCHMNKKLYNNETILL